MDNEPKPAHRLAAIMATDVVSYSKLMQADEALALAALSTIRSATERQVEQHRGRITNTAGDSVVAAFGSAVEAVSCAVALQETLSREPQGGELQIRIGIHLGDVVDKGGDLLGTAVNIAARLEGIAQPGTIVVSAAVRDAIAGKLAASLTDLGLQALKNLEEPLRAYAIAPSRGPHPAAPQLSGQALPLPSRPSIAVLPFDNLSGDREQEYFADGIVEEIITALSRMRWLFVIARNSSFTYKGRAVDVKQIGRDLGVRYVLEGSVRKAGNKVRITGQLIDASTGAHLWADRFDGTLEDIFDLQDQVTASVVGAISPKLEQAEIERARRKPTEKLDAYDLYLRGLEAFYKWNRDANDEALSLFRRAIELDPHFAASYGMAAHCFSQRKENSWMVDRSKDLLEAARFARQAVEIGREDPVALCFGGLTLGYVIGKIEDGDKFVDRALAIDPNMAAAWFASSWLKLCKGELDTAINNAARAMRLSPLDTYAWRGDIALTYFCAGRYGEAISWAEGALRDHPEDAYVLRILSAGYAMEGRAEDAHAAMAKLRKTNPQLRLSNLGDVISPLREEHSARYIEALRLAGLPE